MVVSACSVSGKRSFMGRSISGFRTRVHFDEQDAMSEEDWLNRTWLTRHLVQNMQNLMWFFKTGLRPIDSTNATEGVCLFRSEGPGEEPRVFAELPGGDFHEFIGSDLISIQADLDRAISGRRPGT